MVQEAHQITRLPDYQREKTIHPLLLRTSPSLDSQKSSHNGPAISVPDAGRSSSPLFTQASHRIPVPETVPWNGTEVPEGKEPHVGRGELM